MNGRQLREYRESHQLSLRQLARKLCDVTPTTLARWESEALDEVPSWVTRALFDRTDIRLTVEELDVFFTEASERRISLEELLLELLRESARERLQRRRERALYGHEEQHRQIQDDAA